MKQLLSVVQPADPHFVADEADIDLAIHCAESVHNTMAEYGQPIRDELLYISPLISAITWYIVQQKEEAA